MSKIQDSSTLSGQMSLPFGRAALLLLSPDDIFQAADSGLLSVLSEDRRIERKPSSIKPRALGDYFSMWANTGPDGGLIVVGMENDGRLTGCSKLPTKLLNDLEKCGTIYCPDARHESKRVPVRLPDGEMDFVVLFRVFYRTDKVAPTVSGHTYCRVGDSKCKLGDEEVRELQRDKRQVDFEQEESIAEYPRDFDTDLISEFVKCVRENRGIPDSHSTEEVLELRHLGRIVQGIYRPNLASSLLFSTDPAREFPGCKIRFLRFDGESEQTGERFNAVKDLFIEGPLPRQIESIEKILEGQLREFSRLGADGKFYSAPEFPKPAWYEAVVNACVHRSYGLRNMNIFVKMFDDRLVIESPGPFPPLVTAANIFDVHHPRNPHLMDAMYYLKFVKCAHEGAKRIRDSMAEMSLPSPEFQEQQADIGHALVRVTLRNNIRQRKVWIDSDAAAFLGETIFATLTPDEKRALNFVAEHGQITVTQLQRVTARTWRTAKKTLERLKARGILLHIRRKGTKMDPAAHYVLRIGR